MLLDELKFLRDEEKRLHTKMISTSPFGDQYKDAVDRWEDHKKRRDEYIDALMGFLDAMRPSSHIQSDIPRLSQLDERDRRTAACEAAGLPSYREILRAAYGDWAA